MKLKKLHEISFNTEDSFVAAKFSKANELIILMSSGNVIKWSTVEEKEEHLFSVKSDIGYADGGFDLKAATSIYTLDDIVVVVNDYKRHGVIHYPGQHNALHISREDYHADITKYPLALFKDEKNIPHIIYAIAWNHIQIMNLDTMQIRTATKSLILKDAEEQRIEIIKKYGEGNRLPWPSEYDYFFGPLHISPNKRFFLSAGWAWGSCDSYRIFDIKKFIENDRIDEIHIGMWEHINRGVCWIDNETIALTYNPFIEGDDNSNENSAHEIHLYKLKIGDVKWNHKIVVHDAKVAQAEIVFHEPSNSIVAYGKEFGLAQISLQGEVLFHNNKENISDYFPDGKLFLKSTDKTISIFQIQS